MTRRLQFLNAAHRPRRLDTELLCVLVSFELVAASRAAPDSGTRRDSSKPVLKTTSNENTTQIKRFMDLGSASVNEARHNAGLCGRQTARVTRRISRN